MMSCSWCGAPHEGGPEWCTTGRVDAARLDALTYWLGMRWADCERCGLADYRENIVLGDFGPLPVVFIGEAPGADEDQRGRPFIGRAGEVLRTLAKHARVPLRQATVVNTLACRPPGNRDPRPGELQACERRVFGVLRALRPKLVVTLGRVPAEWLLRRRVYVTKERGKVVEAVAGHWWSGPALITLHPAYVLRNPSAAGDLAADLLTTRRMLNGG